MSSSAKTNEADKIQMWMVTELREEIRLYSSAFYRFNYETASTNNLTAQQTDIYNNVTA